MKKLLSIALWLLSIVSLIFIHTRMELGIVMIALMIGLIWLHFKENKKIDWVVVLLGLAIITEFVWMLTYLPYIYVIARLAILITVIYLLLIDKRVSFKEKSLMRNIVTGLGIFVALIGIFISGYLNVVFIQPLALTSLLSDGNVTEANTELTTLDNGVIYTKDVQYGTTYPSSFLDVYQTTVESEHTPTFIYVHGGGFIFGDKAYGDPFGDTDGLIDYYHSLLDQGYNVVSLNYALASDYKYPTPIYQLTEAVHYLNEHAEDYGLDMSNVVFGGGSAGGQIIGQFVALQTNDDYRTEMNIEQTLQPSQIKAAIFNSAVLDSARMNRVGPFYADWLMDSAIRAYFDTDNPDEDEKVFQSNVIEHATEEFPPAYIDDAKYGSLADQAVELSEKLTELGVYNELYIIDGVEHSFEIGKSQKAIENLQRQIDFLDEVNS